VTALTGYAFAATPEGVAQELAERLGHGLCDDCRPWARAKWRALAEALFVAAGREAKSVRPERRSAIGSKMQERIGRAVDVFTGHGLPSPVENGSAHRQEKRSHH
jgi:hypothetical protein